MVPGYRLARLSGATAALKLVSEQRSQPDVIARSLATLRDQLEAGQYIGRTVKDLTVTVTDYDRAVRQLQQDLPTQAAAVSTIANAWAEHRARLAPIVSFKGVPYRDSDVAGTRMTSSGSALLENARVALKGGREATVKLTESMTAVGAGSNTDAAAGTATLRHR
jgi:hypothetical protein